MLQPLWKQIASLAWSHTPSLHYHLSLTVHKNFYHIGLKVFSDEFSFYVKCPFRVIGIIEVWELRCRVMVQHVVGRS